MRMRVTVFRFGRFRSMRMSVMLVCVFRLKKADAVREGDTQQQYKREPEAVMRMELHFGQQITQRDTEEDTCGKGEGTADDDVLVF